MAEATFYKMVYILTGNGQTNYIGAPGADEGSFNTIINGHQNKIWATCINTDYNVISSGSGNYISDSLFGFIGSGTGNAIDSACNVFIGTGNRNSINPGVSLSFIGGGQGNAILKGIDSAIWGGETNIVTANCNAILGGFQNTDSGYSLVGIFGCNIAAVANNTFHINCLNTCDTPRLGAPVGAPSETIYWDVPGSAGKTLYIV